MSTSPTDSDDQVSMALEKALAFPSDFRPFDYDEEVKLPEPRKWTPHIGDHSDLLEYIEVTKMAVDDWFDEQDYFDDLIRDMDELLASVRPTLAKRASREQFVAAIEEFKREYTHFVDLRRKDFVAEILPHQATSGQLKADIKTLKWIATDVLPMASEATKSSERRGVNAEDESLYLSDESEDDERWDESDDEDDEHWDDSDDEDEPQMSKRPAPFQKTLEALEHRITEEELVDKSDMKKQYEIIARQYHDLFLSHVGKMVVNQSKLRDWLKSNGSGHLDKKEHVSVPRLMKEKPASGSAALPLEISTMVFSYCDLESSVSLRQVSTAWYNSYQHSERSLEAKVQERFPWMKPELEMETWGDCALVFVGRLGNPKWMEASSFDNCKATEAYQPKSLLADELPRGKKLPKDFRGLHEHNDQADCVGECEMVHLYEHDRGCSTIMDPWTLKAHRSQEEEWKVVETRDESDVIEYKGVRFSMPHPHSPLTLDEIDYDHFEEPAIKLNKHSIEVRTEDYIFMLQRHKPHCNILHYIDDDGAVEIGEIYIVKSCEHHGPGFKMLDPIGHRLQSFPVVCSFEDEPVAFYRGLVWWHVDGAIIPTFFDMAKNTVFRSRNDRIIKVAARGMGEKFQQCTREPHLIVRNLQSPGQGIELIDLSTGIVTLVNKPGHGYLLPGYVNSKFQVKYIGDVAMDRYTFQLVDF